MLHLLRFSLFFGLFVLGFALYYPGLDGELYFDDPGNLQTLGADGGVQDFLTLWQYLNSNNSGPTGRPISMASFLINDNNWPPASIFSFKYTNLLLHLLNGVLVFWLIWLLLKKQGYRFALSLIVTAWWLLHPMQVSTTLYVVQRMTELSALFTLLGMIGYLYGRSLACRRPRWGFMTMSVSLGVFGLLAIFSKENGVLLLLYLLVIEFFWLRPSGQTPPPGFRRFAVVFLYLPAALFAVYLLHIGYSALNSGLPFRDFTPAERFYSQLGIAFDYLRKILLPPFAGWGLYHHYPIVQSLWQPLTLLAALGWLTLIVLAFVWRQKYWLFSFAVAWFIAGHLLETFAITGLEFAFLHRNYLAMLGVLLAVSMGIFHVRTKIKELLWLAFAALLIYSIWVMAEQAKLWGKSVLLAAVWAEEAPRSYRAQLEAYNVMRLLGKEAEQDYYLERMYQTAADNSGVILQVIQHECRRKELTPERLTHWQEKLTTLHFENLATSAAIALRESILAGNCLLDWKDFIKTINALSQQKNADQYGANLDFLIASTYEELRDLNQTMLHLEAAYEKDANVDILLRMAENLVSAGLYQEAIEKLEVAEKQLKKDPLQRKPSTLTFVQKRIQAIQEEMKKP